jgi:lipopolysaccharide export system protein LptC
MSLTPLPVSTGPSPHRPRRTLGATARPLPSPAAIARRRWMVALTKFLLPMVALALLATIALWPQIDRNLNEARVSFRRGMAIPESGQLTDARYHGVDDHGRPYTVTAAVARQVAPERIDLTKPAGDVSLESGSWLMAKAQHGVYLQRTQQLDLSGDVTLYRDDGITLVTDAAAVDLKAGAAAGAALTHAEGPFGTLDAQGFAATDSGSIIHFAGPGRLVLNGTHQ